MIRYGSSQISALLHPFTGTVIILHTLHPAFEDGTDIGFRNVGKPQSDAGEIPKRIHTRFINVYIVTSSCILISRHDHVLRFISIYI